MIIGARKLLLLTSLCMVLNAGVALADDKGAKPAAPATPAAVDCDMKHMDMSKMTAQEHAKIMKACRKRHQNPAGGVAEPNDGAPAQPE